MGTNQTRTWQICLERLEDLILLREDDFATPDVIASSVVDALEELEACPKATWKKLVLEMQVPLKLATAFVAVADQDPDNNPVFKLSSHGLCVFLRNAIFEGCASGGAAASKVERAVRQQLEQSVLLQMLPEFITDTAADMTEAAKDAAAAAGSSSSSSSSSAEYPPATVSRAEMLLVFVGVLLPWWANGLPRQRMAGSLAAPVCHLSLASVHLVSNLMLGQQQPHPDVALVLQGILHKALKISAEMCSPRRGCVPFEMNQTALNDHPALLQVINSQHFMPSLALNCTVLAVAHMVRERQSKQQTQGSTASTQGGAGAEGASQHSSSSSSSRGVRLRLDDLPAQYQTTVVKEYIAQAVSNFTEAVRLLPKLSRSHRKLFALLGVDPRVGVWAAVTLAQPSIPFQQGPMPVGEFLTDVAAMYNTTMDLFLRPGPYISAANQAELWQQHLQLPQSQLQLEQQLALLVPFALLHGAARLPIGRAACLKMMVSAVAVAAAASPRWLAYTEALPPVTADPWLQGQVPVQWVEDMLPALLKLGGKAVDGLTATAAAAGAAAQGGSSSRVANAESEHSKLLMSALEGTVATLGQILQRCTKAATDSMTEAEQREYENRGLPIGPVVASDSPTLGLLRACLAAAADAFAVVEAFVRAAAAGVAGGFAREVLAVGVFQLLLSAWQGTMPAVSLCQADDAGKSVRAFYSLLTSCLKLQSTHSAPSARLCAGAAGATFLVSRAATALLQDRHWPTALLQAAGIPVTPQRSAAGGGVTPTWYDPASRLPSLVVFGRCCLLWAQELTASLPGLLVQLAAPRQPALPGMAGSSSSRSSGREGPRTLSSLQQLPEYSAAWVFFSIAYVGAPAPPSHLHMIADTMRRWTNRHADLIIAAGCDAQALLQQLQQLLVAQQEAANSTTNVAAAVETFVQQLVMTGTAYSAVPLKSLCNNPICGAVSGPSEGKLVGGVGLCKGCLGVRYCSKACQNQHWKQHKPVCKALAERKAAAAAAGAQH